MESGNVAEQGRSHSPGSLNLQPIAIKRKEKLLPVCHPCTVAGYLIEEAQILEENFTAGIIMWHNKCKGGDCSCGCTRSEQKLLRRLWRLWRSHRGWMCGGCYADWVKNHAINEEEKGLQ